MGLSEHEFRRHMAGEACQNSSLHLHIYVYMLLKAPITITYQRCRFVQHYDSGYLNFVIEPFLYESCGLVREIAFG